MSKTKRSKTPTVIALAVLVLAAFLMISPGFTATIVMKYGDFELTTNSLGFAVLVVGLVFVAYLYLHPVKVTKSSVPAFYDMIPPQGHRDLVECPNCGASMPISDAACRKCGYMRPLY